MKHDLISKSLLMSHRQCARRAWIEASGADNPEFTAGARMLQEQGQRVHEAGRSLFNGAVRVASSLTMEQAAEETAKAMSSGQSQIIEAGFVSGKLGVRVDVLERGTRGYRIIEIKSGTTCKPEYIDDCAIQYACATEAGLAVEAVELMQPSTGRAREAGGNGSEVLVRQDITDDVHMRAMAVRVWVRECEATLKGDEPMISAGEHCSDPNPCPFSHRCGKVEQSTDRDRVEWLPSQAKPVSEYVAAGMTRISELPDDAFEHPRNALVRMAVQMGRGVVTEEFAQSVAQLEFPRRFVDFEAISFAIPRFVGMRSHQAVPFQWSCHRQDVPGGELVHEEFLDTTGNDPRRMFAVTLVQVAGESGSVIVYSAYEKTRIKEMALLFADLRDALLRIVDRLVDLLPLVRRGYYHPDMMGSWSLKKVAPTLPKVRGVGEYAELEDVGDGMEAQAAYMTMIDMSIIGIDRAALRRKMSQYCGTDTAQMYRIVTVAERALAVRLEVYEKPAAKPRRVKKADKALAQV